LQPVLAQRPPPWLAKAMGRVDRPSAGLATEASRA